MNDMCSLKISIPKPRSKPELPSGVLPDFYLIRDQYPRISEKIALLWGSAALQNHINDLIFDERGDREGFPKHIAAAILRIYSYHSKLVLEDHKNAWVKATY